jgi:hypothetical protein
MAAADKNRSPARAEEEEEEADEEDEEEEEEGEETVAGGALLCVALEGLVEPEAAEAIAACFVGLQAQARSTETKPLIPSLVCTTAGARLLKARLGPWLPVEAEAEAKAEEETEEGGPLLIRRRAHESRVRGRHAAPRRFFKRASSACSSCASARGQRVVLFRLSNCLELGPSAGSGAVHSKHRRRAKRSQSPRHKVQTVWMRAA